MSGEREPTDLDHLGNYTGAQLIEQIRDRIKDLYRADNYFSKDVHKGVAFMLLEELEKRL